MHIEFLVEEPSAEAALRNLVPTLLGTDVSFQVHPYGGKQDLLAKLPARLRGYRPWLPPDWRLVVLVDADEGDCHTLKARLEDAARNAGLLTRSAAPAATQFQVLNRLAIQDWRSSDDQRLLRRRPRRTPCHRPLRRARLGDRGLLR